MQSTTDSPSGGHVAPWRRWTLAACMFLCVAAFGFLEPFVSLYLELSGLKRSQIGLVTGIGTGMALLIQPLLGRLSDRLDARRPLMFGAALMAGIAYLLYREADSLVGFILLTALGINGIMYLNTAAAVLVGRMVSREGPSSARGGGGTFAAYRVWGSIGYVVVSLLAGWLLSRGIGARGTVSRATIDPLFLYGPLLFVLVAIVVLFVPDPKKAGVSAAAAEEGGTIDAEHARDAGACDRNLQRFLRAYFLYIFAFTGSSAFLSLYLKSLGATPLWITGVFAAGVFCEAVVMLQVGRLSDRFGRRPLLAVAFAFMPIRLLLYIPATGPLWVLGVQTIHGINFGIMAAVAVAFVNDLCAEESRGATQARLAGTAGLAAACGPAAGGWLAQRFGIPVTFGLMACVAAAGLGLFLWKVRESHAASDRLYRHGPAFLRPVLGVLYIPLGWLSRHPRLRREPGRGTSDPAG